MLKFKDLFVNEEIELDERDIDFISYEKDNIIIVNVDGLAYKTLEIEFK